MISRCIVIIVIVVCCNITITNITFKDRTLWSFLFFLFLFLLFFLFLFRFFLNTESSTAKYIAKNRHHAGSTLLGKFPSRCNHVYTTGCHLSSSFFDTLRCEESNSCKQCTKSSHNNTNTHLK